MKERQQIVEEGHNRDWTDQVEGYMPCFRKDQKGDSEVVVDYFEDFYYFYGNRFHNLVFCFILCIRFDNNPFYIFNRYSFYEIPVEICLPVFFICPFKTIQRRTENISMVKQI